MLKLAYACAPVSMNTVAPEVHIDWCIYPTFSLGYRQLGALSFRMVFFFLHCVM